LKALYDAAVEVYKTSTTDAAKNKRDKAARDTAKTALDAKIKEINDNKALNTTLKSQTTGTAFLKSEYEKLKKEREDFTTNLNTAAGSEIDVADFAFDAAAGAKPVLKKKGGAPAY